jgi:hypothetical protein
MIVDSQYGTECIAIDSAKPVKAAVSRKRACRHSRGIVTKFLSPVEFAVPVNHIFEPQAWSAAEQILAEDLEWLEMV